MNIIARGQAFVTSLRALAGRSAWDWRRCPRCGDMQTSKWGTYRRYPWTLAGRQRVVVQRHRCAGCGTTYSETSPYLVRGGWYAREVRRCAIDGWQHGGSSCRRVAEWLRSWLGQQERWLLWCPLATAPAAGARCWLSASTIHRWVDAAGQAAQATVPAQLADVPSAGQLGIDGLWARLRGQTRRVVLAMVDSATGLIWPPVVGPGEEADDWAALFRRAAAAGLAVERVWGGVSDGAGGVLHYLTTALTWVNHQRCVFHLWRNLAGEFQAQAADAARGLHGAAAAAVRRKVRRELAALVRAVYDAPSYAAAQVALATLAAHARGAGLAQTLTEHLDAALVHLGRYNRGLGRVTPEWLWRDFRFRLSHGRNHRSEARLERAALLFAIYHNFEPAQERRERHRRYRRSGQSPLALAGVPPPGVSYLDALAI